VVKRISYKLICFLLAVTFATVFLGCRKENQVSENNNSITFTDALKRKVVLKEKPRRVAALIGSFADVWVLSGGELVAAAEDAWEDFGIESDAVSIGGAHSPSLELLLSANPDFVIASASTSSNIEMQTALENVGITVAYFDVDNFEDYLGMLDICTDITGRKDLYEKNGLEIQSRIEKIKTEFNSKNIPESRRKVLLLRASSSSVKAKNSQGTVLGEMLKSLGCINIADSQSGLLENLSIENIIKNEPYHIFVVSMGDAQKAEKNLKSLMNGNPAWGKLKAVKEERFHIMESRLFNLKPNDDWAVAYEKLCKILQ